MKRFYLLLILSFLSLSLSAQQVTVPSRLQFGGMNLRLTAEARREVQEYVDALTAHRGSYEKRVRQMAIHFPIVEQVLEEEGVPTDLKYLLVQESGFVPDAVSSSNAVGYWQFKDFTGREMGLRIDAYVDERMHLAEATRGAAKYLKRHNFYFNNWVHSIIGYHQGLEGAKKRVNEKENGSRRMTINKKTFWYFKKYLAHKLAFEGALEDQPQAPFLLEEYEQTAGKNLKQIARELEVDYEELEAFNKWLRRGRIPSEKIYTVIVPRHNTDIPLAEEQEVPILMTTHNRHHSKKYITQLDLSLKAAVSKPSSITLVNGIPAVIAREGDTMSSLAELGDISMRRFRRYNDLSRRSRIKTGQIYYLKKKHRKAKVHYHVVREGETLWEIAQLYGVRLRKVMRKNRMKRSQESDKIKTGRLLWMRFIRPRTHPVQYIPKENPQNRQEKDTIPSLPLQTASEVVVKVETQVRPNVVETPPDEVPPVREIPADTVPPQPVEEKTVEMKWAEAQPLDSVQDKPSAIEEPEEIRTEKQALPADTIDAEQQALKQEALEQAHAVEIQNNLPATHRVVKGDTYFSISRTYDVSITELLEWNQLGINDPLAIGMELRLQKAEEAAEGVQKGQENPEVPELPEFHEVQAGETLYGISRQYELSVEQLMNWNEKEDFTVKVGEKLRLHPN